MSSNYQKHLRLNLPEGHRDTVYTCDIGTWGLPLVAQYPTIPVFAEKKATIAVAVEITVWED